MIDTLTIKNYKCFEEITLPSISQVNLISGPNNVGKSALLEAISLNAGFFNPNVNVLISTFRKIPQQLLEGLFEDIFFGYNYENRISFQCSGTTNDDNRTLRIEPFETTPVTKQIRDNIITSEIRKSIGLKYFAKVKTFESKLYIQNNQIVSDAKPFNAVSHIFMPGIRSGFNINEFEAYTELSIKGLDKIVTEALIEFDPNIEELKVLSPGNENVFYVKLNYFDQLVPINTLGSGLSFFLKVLFNMVKARGGSLIMDEIENGIYHKNLPILWKQIQIFAKKFDVQVFASTHSYENVVAAAEVFEGDDSFSFYRLEKEGLKTRIVDYDLEALEASIEFNAELR